jgi:hypothetical protein
MMVAVGMIIHLATEYTDLLEQRRSSSGPDEGAPSPSRSAVQGTRPRSPSQHRKGRSKTARVRITTEI